MTMNKKEQQDNGWMWMKKGFTVSNDTWTTHLQAAMVDKKWNLVDRCVCMQVDIRGKMKHRNICMKRNAEQRYGLLWM